MLKASPEREPPAAGPQAPSRLAFGPYVIDLRARRLMRGTEVLAVSPRAFDILAILVQRAGQTVSKMELMQRVWPDVFVEESNLAQHVSQLRRLLGDATKQPEYVATIPRQGYQFVAAVRSAAGAEVEPAPTLPRLARRTMVAPLALALVVLVLAAMGLLWRGSPRPERTPSRNADARRAFVRGQFLLAQNKPESAVLARDAFAEAVRLDPAFVDARADLALSYVSMFLARQIPRAEALDQSRAAAAAALTLSNASAEAHAAQGAVFLQLLDDPASAEAEVRRALALDRSNIMAMDILARALRQSGRFDESIATARRQLALDPTSVRAHMNVAQSLLFSGRELEAASELCRQALVLDPTFGPLLEQAADVAEAAGRMDESIAYRARFERAANREGLADALETTHRERGYAVAMAQHLESRLALLDKRRRDDPASGFERGRLLARLGRVDEAFAALDAAASGGYSVGVFALRYHPAYRAIRADPRFKALEARANPH